MTQFIRTGKYLFFVGFFSFAFAQEESHQNHLASMGFQLHPEKSQLVTFKVDQLASTLRGSLSKEEIESLRNDQAVWGALKKPDSKVAPSPRDVVLYPASGVDFGLPVNVLEQAGLFVGVDIENTFSNEQVINWQKNPESLDLESLFQDRKYVKTIPYMVTGDAGNGAEFGKSFFKNLVTVLPSDAVIETISFILDYQPVGNSESRRSVGPHLAVTWKSNGQRQTALLISAPMLSPEQGKDVWWYKEIEKIQPAYGVMKRPQGFSFDEVFGQMCEWSREKGGIILSEGNTEDSTQTGSVLECLQKSRYQRKEVTAKDLGRDGKPGREGAVFGFDDTAVLVEVFGPKKMIPGNSKSRKKRSQSREAR